MGKIETPKLRQANKNKKRMLVRYGRMALLGWFEHNESYIRKVHSHVVVKTDRGLELGQIVGPFCYKSGQFKLSGEQVEKYFDRNQAEQKPHCKSGKFVRYATTQDLSEEKHLQKSAKEELQRCKKLTKELALPIKIVDVEHLFGGERIIFYFTADGRIDFRELVKKLAQEYQTRIEMRQIGSRDEAKLISDYETCGLECCCRTFLKILKPVNMRMAKLQKTTLDPSKISGHCGRLKCCLRYEDQTYKELKERLPKRNTRVKTVHGEGKVVDQQILTQLVMVKTDDGIQFAVPAEEVEMVGTPANNSNEQKDTETNNTNKD